MTIIISNKSTHENNRHKIPTVRSSAFSSILDLDKQQTSSDNNDLEIFTRATVVDVFNKQTNTIYEYYSTFKGKINEKPDNIYKIAADGSSMTINK